ncbi:MAG: VTT domain-containing protein [bacterium]|nr:VTT domain-containing protein [bacterium]
MTPAATPTPSSTRAWPLVLLAVFTLVGPLIGAAVLLWSNAEWLPPLREMELRAPAFVLAGMLLAGLSMLPTHAVALVGGMVFDGLLGSVFATTAVCLAAVIGFAVNRPLAGPRTMAWLERKPRTATIHRALLDRGRLRAAGIIGLIRLSPIMPFALTNLWLAGVGTNWREYTAGSALGLMPRIVLVAFAGEGLATLDLSQSGGRTALVLGIVGTIAALAVIGRISQRALAAAAR